MSRKNHALPEEQQAKLIELLNRRLELIRKPVGM